MPTKEYQVTFSEKPMITTKESKHKFVLNDFLDADNPNEALQKALQEDYEIQLRDFSFYAYVIDWEIGDVTSYFVDKINITRIDTENGVFNYGA